MDTEYSTELSVKLSPIFHCDPPIIKIGVNELTQVLLDSDRTFNFEFSGIGKQCLTIEFLNKKDSDTIPKLGIDKAVLIKEISFFNISDPRFIWEGRYCPIYPEPWYSEQKIKPSATLTGQDRLSWNGVWILEFSLPVFTWMHQVKNLGWIYD